MAAIHDKFTGLFIPYVTPFNHDGSLDPDSLARLTQHFASLPGVAANRPTIVVDAGNVVTVTIFWQHPEEAAMSPPEAPHRYSAVAAINCC